MQTLEENFRILRVRVAGDVQAPAVIVVSAALPGDGATFVACGLARAFAEAGQHTVLVDANAANPGVAAELGLSPIAPVRGSDLHARNGEIARLSVASLVGTAGAPQTGSVSALLDAMRARFAVTVIDAGALPSSAAALELARSADGVVLALKLGRRPSGADLEVRRVSEGRGGFSLLGIVPTRARGRRALAARPVRLSAPDPLPRLPTRVEAN